MNLIRFNPYCQVSSSAHRSPRLLGTLLDDFFAPIFTIDPSERPYGTLTLKADIYEKNGCIIIDAELPGMAKEEISVDINGKLLTLRGERKSDKEINEEKCFRQERSYGRFERTFSLPFEAKSDKVKATYHNGILKLEIPRPEQQVAKTITIN